MGIGERASGGEARSEGGTFEEFWNDSAGPGLSASLGISTVTHRREANKLRAKHTRIEKVGVVSATQGVGINERVTALKT